MFLELTVCISDIEESDFRFGLTRAILVRPNWVCQVKVQCRPSAHNPVGCPGWVDRHWLTSVQGTGRASCLRPVRSSGLSVRRCQTDSVWLFRFAVVLVVLAVVFFWRQREIVYSARHSILLPETQWNGRESEINPLVHSSFYLFLISFASLNSKTEHIKAKDSKRLMKTSPIRLSPRSALWQKWICMKLTDGNTSRLPWVQATYRIRKETT